MVVNNSHPDYSTVPPASTWDPEADEMPELKNAEMGCLASLAYHLLTPPGWVKMARELMDYRDNRAAMKAQEKGRTQILANELSKLEGIEK